MGISAGNRIMTPTEALAQALLDASDENERLAESMEFYLVGTRAECASSILAALPPGWRLCGPDDVTVTVDGLAEALWRYALDPGEAAAILAVASANTTPATGANDPREEER
jgi:hypothetical protein